MAQHLLVAADRFQLPRLRRICERRLCETVEVSFKLSVSTAFAAYVYSLFVALVFSLILC